MKSRSNPTAKKNPIDKVENKSEKEIVKNEDDTTVNQETFEQSGGGYTPYNEEVKNRDYTKPNVVIGSGVIEPIPEPFIVKPVINLNQEIKNDSNSNNDNVNGLSGAKPNTLSSPQSEITDADKKRSAESMVDMLLDGYSIINAGIGKLMQVSDNKKIELSEKIDLNTPISVSSTQSIPLSAFIETTNEEIAKACEVDDEFRKKIKPPLTRIALKRGWGMTDEQEVLYLGIRDVGEKTAVLYSLKSTVNNIFNILIQQAEMQKQGIVPPSNVQVQENVTEAYKEDKAVADDTYEILEDNQTSKSARKGGRPPKNEAITSTLQLESDEIND